MKRAWPLLALLFFIISLPPPANGAAPLMEFEEDEYDISVDPSDPYQGVLKMEGTVSMDLSMAETVTISLSSNISEYQNGFPTGRYWSSMVYFEGGVENNIKVFSRLDRTAVVIVELDPINHNPEVDHDIPVPPGLPPEVEGRVVVRASYTGSYEGELTRELTIYPMEYTLINLTTGTLPVEVTAEERLVYTLTVKNAGNVVTSCYMEIPLLADLEEEGWTTTLEEYSFIDLLPGEERRPHLILVAPDEIPMNRQEDLEIMLKTYEVDPESGDPTMTRTLLVRMDLIRSNSDGPILDPDPGNTTSSEEEDGNGSVVILVSIIVAVGAVGGLLVLMLVRNRGDEDEDEDDHSSLFRI